VIHWVASPVIGSANDPDEDVLAHTLKWPVYQLGESLASYTHKGRGAGVLVTVNSVDDK
jgi:hypothetical protein